MSLAPPYKPSTWKAIIVSAVLLAVIGVTLLFSDRCGTYFGDRSIRKGLENVNAAMANVNAAKAVVGNDRVDEGVVVEQVTQAVSDVIAASNATDQAKTEANAALANYRASVNANRPTGTTQADLEKKLAALDQ